MIISAVVWLLGWCGFGRRLRTLCAGLALLGFVLVVGPDASVQRAAIMSTVMLVSGFGSKRARALPALGVAMLIMLLSDPWQALAPGFALSVAATAGIVLLAPAIERLVAKPFPRPLPRWLTLPIAVAASAQLACGPLVLLLQPGLPALGVPANVLAGTIAPLGTGLGVLALVTLPGAPAVGEAFVFAASLPARAVAWVAEETAGLPWARLEWPGGWPGTLLLAAVEIALLGVWYLRGSNGAEHATRGRAPWKAALPLRAALGITAATLIAVASGVFLGPTLVQPMVSRAAIPSDWSIVACDVGQGDAILVRDPSAPAEVMLVDTGDEPEQLLDCLSMFGVDRITLLVLTHDDRDHVGALSSVIGRTDTVLVAPENQEDGASRTVVDALGRAGVPYATGSAGMEGGTNGLSWRVLAPSDQASPADSNAASLVMWARAGDLSIMLLGDTGEEEQRALIASGQPLTADVVKIAHHGSRDQAAELPGLVGARIALVSVGEGNGYGHPTAQTIEAHEVAGGAVLRTDRYGSIALSSTGSAPGPSSNYAEKSSPLIWLERAPTCTGPAPENCEQ